MPAGRTVGSPGRKEFLKFDPLTFLKTNYTSDVSIFLLVKDKPHNEEVTLTPTYLEPQPT